MSRLKNDWKEIDARLATLAAIRDKIKRRKMESRTEENEERIKQHIDAITSFANAARDFTEDNANYDFDDLLYMLEELQGLISEETAILEWDCPVIGFEIESLKDGRVLIRFLSDDHDYEFTRSTYTLSRDCFAALVKANLTTRTYVNTHVDHMKIMASAGYTWKDGRFTLSAPEPDVNLDGDPPTLPDQSSP